MLVGGGLRTLTGGQVMLQVPGFLAVQNERNSAARSWCDLFRARRLRLCWNGAGEVLSMESRCRLLMAGQTYCVPLNYCLRGQNAV